MKDRIIFRIDADNSPPPIEWPDISITASADQVGVQPNIETQAFTFVDEAAQRFIDHIESGETGGTGIFEGLDADVEVRDENNVLSVFEGFYDMSDAFEEISPAKVKVKVKKDNGLNTLDEDINSITFGYLEEIGAITNADYQDITKHKTICGNLRKSASHST